MPWMWIIIPFFLFMILRRSGWSHSDTRRRMKRKMQKHIRAGARPQLGDLDYKQDAELAEHREYIDSLESRVAELENRLDFTERLLAERREPISEDS